jgi:hypothetical protein
MVVVATTSLCSFVNVVQKEEKENDRQKKINRDREKKKFVVGGL